MSNINQRSTDQRAGPGTSAESSEDFHTCDISTFPNRFSLDRKRQQTGTAESSFIPVLIQHGLSICADAALSWHHSYMNHCETGNHSFIRNIQKQLSWLCNTKCNKYIRDFKFTDLLTFMTETINENRAVIKNNNDLVSFMTFICKLGFGSKGESLGCKHSSFSSSHTRSSSNQENDEYDV